MGSAATIITMIAMTTAATMTSKCSAMPTAVITESSENTMSSTAIWAITVMNDAVAGPPMWRSPSTSVCISCVPLYSRNRPPAARTMSRQEYAVSKRVNIGACNDKMKEMLPSNAIRIKSASVRPIRRASALWCSGRRSEMMARKITLSIPSTTSNRVSVVRLNQTLGSERSSIMFN